MSGAAAAGSGRDHRRFLQERRGMKPEARRVMQLPGAKDLKAYARAVACAHGWQWVHAAWDIHCIEDQRTALLTIYEDLRGDARPRSVTILFHRDEMLAYGQGLGVDAIHARITREIHAYPCPA